MRGNYHFISAGKKLTRGTAILGFLLLQLPATTLFLQAQVMIELGRKVDKLNSISSINVYGSGEIEKKISYNQIGGSPFYRHQWQQGRLYDRQGRKYGQWPVRFNLVSQEVHYLDSLENEMAVPAELIGKIEFLDSVSGRITDLFLSANSDMARQTDCKQCLYQELNKGHTTLLKITRRIVKEGDSLFGTLKRYYYYDNNEYFVEAENQFNRLQKLSREDFFSHVPGASLYSDWIKKQKLGFKKEEDYLIFLKYYNGIYKKDGAL
ncbi:MAG: hypothetical protein FJY20_02255 [Bacteroidetes bacterium]|nr:hypothetical protein [Bacteroidota bacterium]